MIAVLKIMSMALLLGFISLSHAMTFGILHGKNPEEREILQALRIFGSQYQVIYASGEITKDTPKQFKRFIKRHNITEGAVLLDSPGGDLSAGIALGLEIRKHKLDTWLSSDCVSSCIYTFAGGVKRMMTEEARLGFHQFYSPYGDAGESKTQAVQAMLIAYLKKMGIDPGVLIYSGLTPPNDVIWLTHEELKASNFITDLDTHPTTAELKFIPKTNKVFLEIAGYPSLYTTVLKPAHFNLTCSGKTLLMNGMVFLEKTPSFNPTHTFIFGVSKNKDTWHMVEECDKSCVRSAKDLTILSNTVAFSRAQAFEALMPAEHLLAIFIDKNTIDYDALKDLQSSEKLTDIQKMEAMYTLGKMGLADISSPEIKEKIRDLISSCK